MLGCVCLTDFNIVYFQGLRKNDIKNSQNIAYGVWIIVTPDLLMKTVSNLFKNKLVNGRNWV